MAKARVAMVEAERVLRDRLFPIVPLLEDESVNEVMVNSGEDIFVETRGEIMRVDAVLSDAAIEAAIRAIISLNEKNMGYIMDARLPGLRVAAALPPVAIHGPMLVIRKHAKRRFRLEEYVESGAFDIMTEAPDGADAPDDKHRMEEGASKGGQGLADFMRWAIRAHKNILLVGGTSSGKTTLLSSCLLEIPNTERVITCEDTNEIVLEQINIVQLEAMPTANITIRDLIRLCLRARPDRIIVGEIRGPEAYDFLDAMNTGHSGSLCTLHADSAFLGLRRLESLIRMSPTAQNLPLRDMRAEIASAIDYVIFQSRGGGKRAPEQVLALDGVTDQGDYQSRLIFNRMPWKSSHASSLPYPSSTSKE